MLPFRLSMLPFRLSMHVTGGLVHQTENLGCRADQWAGPSQ